MKKLIWFLPLLLVSFLAMSCTEAPPAAIEESNEAVSKKPTDQPFPAKMTLLLTCGDFDMESAWDYSGTITTYYHADGSWAWQLLRANKGTVVFKNVETGKTASGTTGPSNHGRCYDEAWTDCYFDGLSVKVVVPGEGALLVGAGWGHWDMFGNVYDLRGRMDWNRAAFEPLCAYLREP
jgi:hypothetical protein